MRKSGLIVTSVLIVALMSSGAFGMYLNMSSKGIGTVSLRVAPPTIEGINLASIESLVKNAMSKASGDDKDGDPKAQYELGVLFYTMYNAAQAEELAERDEGKSYARLFNLNQAAYWLKRSSEKDYAPAQFLLSHIDFWDLGEPEGGAMWLGKAVEAGYPKAQAIMAERLLNSELSRSFTVLLNEPSDTLKQAIELATKSANQGDALGMYVLSRIYGSEVLKGKNPVYDKAKAEEWRKKAKEAAKKDPMISFSD